MKNFIKELTRTMQGAFFPKNPREKRIIQASIRHSITHPKASEELILKELTKSMQGAFAPQNSSEELIVKEINDSLKTLVYYGPRHDKKNMRKDVAAFNRDFNKAKKDVKAKFEPAL